MSAGISTAARREARTEVGLDLVPEPASLRCCFVLGEPAIELGLVHSGTGTSSPFAAIRSQSAWTYLSGSCTVRSSKLSRTAEPPRRAARAEVAGPRQVTKQKWGRASTRKYRAGGGCSVCVGRTP
jgi:hypothetical protein